MKKTRNGAERREREGEYMPTSSNNINPKNLFHVSRFTFHNSFWHAHSHAYLSNHVTKFSDTHFVVSKRTHQRRSQNMRAKQNVMFNINFNFLREKNSFVMTYEANLTTATSANTQRHTQVTESWKMCCGWNNVRGDAKVLFYTFKAKNVTLFWPHSWNENESNDSTEHSGWWWKSLNSNGIA